MRESLPAEVALLVGGCALPAYRDALEKIGAVSIENLLHRGSALDGLRQPAGSVQALGAFGARSLSKRETRPERKSSQYHWRLAARKGERSAIRFAPLPGTTGHPTLMPPPQTTPRSLACKEPSGISTRALAARALASLADVS